MTIMLIWIISTFLVILHQLVFAASNITQTGATIAWTAPLNGTPQADYNYEIAKVVQAGSRYFRRCFQPFCCFHQQLVSVSGLTPLTGYSVYVQSNCGGSDVSFWTRFLHLQQHWQTVQYQVQYQFQQ